MVAHLVHAAADGSLAVVAVLLDARGSANPLVSRLWQYLPAQEGPEKALDNVQIDILGFAHRPGLLHLHRIPHDPALHRERDVVRPEGAGANLAGAG